MKDLYIRLDESSFKILLLFMYKCHLIFIDLYRVNPMWQLRSDLLPYHIFVLREQLKELFTSYLLMDTTRCDKTFYLSDESFTNVISSFLLKRLKGYLCIISWQDSITLTNLITKLNFILKRPVNDKALYESSKTYKHYLINLSFILLYNALLF